MMNLFPIFIDNIYDVTPKRIIFVYKEFNSCLFENLVSIPTTVEKMFATKNRFAILTSKIANRTLGIPVIFMYCLFIQTHMSVEWIRFSACLV